MKKIKEIVGEVERTDPVSGQWHVPKSEKGTLWADASDLALGVVLEVEDTVAEDGTWMRKTDDYNHINVAELEAVLKGVNMGVHWGLKKITVKTDSKTVEGWLKSTLGGERRVKTKGAAEMLIRRRLGVLKSLADEFQLRIEVQYVQSTMNKADELTRVWRKWVVPKPEEDAACLSVEELRDMHECHHMGVERTWYLAKKVDDTTSKEAVKKVVRQCEECQSIDPAPARHRGGKLSVDENWMRAAVDVTHYRNKPYVSFVDCGLGRFAIWREMKGESATEISNNLENIFYERGPIKEALLDNAPAFRSEELTGMLKKWDVEPFYRAAYRPNGNGIVERHHRTIKAMAERMRGHPVEAVYWYKMAPQDGQKEESVPQTSVFAYSWRMKGYECEPEMGEPKSEVRVDDEVWVKPGNPRCTVKWRKGTITNVNSENNVDVDGMARHILDVRTRVADSDESEEEVSNERLASERRYPVRERTSPVWMRDYSI